MKTKKARPIVVVDRGRKHRQFVDEIMKGVEQGNSVHHEEMLVLVAEIRDLRALLHNSEKSG